jgi:hypothetical protein
MDGRDADAAQQRVRPSTLRIMATLSSTGVAAGTAKCFQVLSTPAASATRDMKPM